MITCAKRSRKSRISGFFLVISAEISICRMETVSGLDNTNSGYIVPVYCFVVHNISTVHGSIPRFRILESWTDLKKVTKEYMQVDMGAEVDVDVPG